MAYSWFRYDGTGSVFDQLNYHALGVKPNCQEGSSICAIYAETQFTGNPRVERPVITEELVVAINFSISTFTPTSNVRLKDY